MIAAELLRFRKRRSLQVIVFAIPLLVAFFFAAGFLSIKDIPVFDPVAFRQDLIDQGCCIGMDPETQEAFLGDMVANEQSNYHQQDTLIRNQRAIFAFAQSVVTALGNGPILLLALILLTATTIGDEFAWGTIRTSLLASSRRRAFLGVRLGGLALTSIAVIVLMMIVGTVMPFVLGVAGSRLPEPMPAVDPGALIVLAVGLLLASLMAIGFAALVTLLLRSGSLTLVGGLVYLAIEAAILTLLTRFEAFQEKGALAWALDAFPLHGMSTLFRVAGEAASGIRAFSGPITDRSIDGTLVPLVALAVWTVVLASLAMWRFQRMDIVE